VTVENIAGGGATAGPPLVAKSPADGYTLLVNTSAQAYSAALLKNLPLKAAGIKPQKNPWDSDPN
jgi:tripartite-type tricarboxylate transporter receptor subunit TctC